MCKTGIARRFKIWTKSQFKAVTMSHISPCKFSEVILDSIPCSPPVNIQHCLPMASDQTDQVFCNPPHSPLVLLSSARRALSRKTKVLVDDELSGARVSGGEDSEADDDGCEIVRT